MPDIILKRPSETKAHEVCFGHGDHVLKAAYYDCPLVYGDDDTINETLAHLVNLACDYRERAEKAERELAKKGERLQNSERKRRIAVKQCQNLERRVLRAQEEVHGTFRALNASQKAYESLRARHAQIESELAALRAAVAWKTGMAGTPEQIASRIVYQYAEARAIESQEPPK